MNLRIYTILLSMTITATQAQDIFKPAPDWSKNANIYEVNIRQYTPEGTFEAFGKHIDRLDNMGVDILWLMPVQPIGEKNRKGTLGSYYSISDYTTTNPEFGTVKEFKKLVEEAHKKDMKVILDWVANHSAFDNVWAKEHPEWYTKDAEGNMLPPDPDWHDVADLNFDVPELRRAMIDAMKYWVTECDVDGFRCDVAYMVPKDFWRQAVRELQEIKPDIFMLAEAEGPEYHAAGFDMTYSWKIHSMMDKVAKGEHTASELEAFIQEDIVKYPEGAYRMNFTTNHDKNSWEGTEFDRLGDGAYAFFVLNATMPGMPLIYSGQEIGLNRALRFFDKDTIGFTDVPKDAAFFKTLLELKKKNEALWNGEHGGTMYTVHTDDQLLIFARQKGEDKVLVILNLSANVVETKLKSEVFEGKYRNVFTGEKVKLKSKYKAELMPWSYLVLED
jgi:cyclomaltodextrinase